MVYGTVLPSYNLLKLTSYDRVSPVFIKMLIPKFHSSTTESESKMFYNLRG